MEPISSAFETLAEISGALLGFAAIAFALDRSPDRLEAEDRLRLWVLLSLSVASIVGGIFPHVMTKLGQSGPLLWRLWSLAYVVAALQIAGVGLALYLRMDSRQRADFRGHTPGVRILVFSQAIILSEVVFAQALNAISLHYHGEEWVCLAGLLLTVVQAAIILLMIVFLRPQRATA